MITALIILAVVLTALAVVQLATALAVGAVIALLAVVPALIVAGVKEYRDVKRERQ